MLHPTGFPMSKSSGQLSPTSHSSHSGASRSVSDAPQVEHSRGWSLSAISFDGILHLLPVNRHVLGRFDAETNFVAAHFDDGDVDVTGDHDGFVQLAG